METRAPDTNTLHIAGGAISTSHHLATEAGAAALRAGGNAIDAALAAAAVLCVVYPNNVALGGDLVALVHSPDGDIRFLNATGTAPASQTLEALRDKHGAKLPLRGIDTVTVPGGVCGWNSLHDHGATLPWASHFDAAIRFAAEGAPTAKSVAAALLEERADLEQDPGVREIFYPGGEPLKAGDPLVQPALAESLRRLAAGGSAEFYVGGLGQAWIAGLRTLGSHITLEDTDAFQAVWEDSIEEEFAGHRVVTSPPNTSGFILLRALRAVRAGITDPLGAGAGDLATAFADGNAVRAAELADPIFGGLAGQALIEMDAPEHPLPGASRPTGDTVGLSAVSADGWAISLINSVFHGFGSAILEPTTGIIFQNRGTSFSLDPASPNAFASGKRPSHTLMPVLVSHGDELAWVPATMGGSAQPQIHTQLLLRVLTGATPAEATHAPRWMVAEPDENGEVVVVAEQGVPDATLRSIETAGFRIKLVPPHSEDLGHSNLIQLGDRRGAITSPASAGPTFDAASDPRSDGSAVIVRSE